MEGGVRPELSETPEKCLRGAAKHPFSKHGSYYIYVHVHVLVVCEPRPASSFKGRSNALMRKGGSTTIHFLCDGKAL